VVCIPKGRRKARYGQRRTALGEGFRERARQQESKGEAGQLRPAHVHLWLSIPPQSAGAQGGGDRKGKRAISSARTVGGTVRNFVGEQFWARGDFVSTVGRDEAVIRQYLEHPEAEDARLEQLELFQKK
jgi:putative transposase